MNMMIKDIRKNSSSELLMRLKKSPTLKGTQTRQRNKSNNKLSETDSYTLSSHLKEYKKTIEPRAYSGQRPLELYPQVFGSTVL